MLNNLLKAITVLALMVGGYAVAMQQNQAPARQRPQYVCNGGQCRLVQPRAAAPVARGSVVAPATITQQGKAFIGSTPAQTASQRAQFMQTMNAQQQQQRATGTTSSAIQPLSTQGIQPIPVPR